MGFFDDIKSLIEDVAGPVTEAKDVLVDAKDQAVESVQQLGDEAGAAQEDIQNTVQEQVDEVKNKFTGGQ